MYLVSPIGEEKEKQTKKRKTKKKNEMKKDHTLVPSYFILTSW
jgi:hypothetical protein